MTHSALQEICFTTIAGQHVSLKDATKMEPLNLRMLHQMNENEVLDLIRARVRCNPKASAYVDGRTLNQREMLIALMHNDTSARQVIFHERAAITRLQTQFHQKNRRPRSFHGSRQPNMGLDGILGFSAAT